MMLAEARAAWGDEVMRRRIAASRMDRVDGWAQCLEERRLLDIGCGQGDVLAEARRRGWSAVGVDERSEGRHHTTAHTVAAGFDVFPDIASACIAQRPQMVTMFQSLERFDDPALALAEAAEALAPGGLLLVEVWESSRWTAARHHGRSRQRFGSTFGLRRISLDEIDRTMSDCGLDTAWAGHGASWVGPSRTEDTSMGGLLSSAVVLEQVSRVRLGRQCVRRVYGDLVTVVARKR